MSYDTYKLRSDLDELAKNHVHCHDEDDEKVQCCTCGGWIWESDHAHMAGWKSGPNNAHEWQCDDCFAKDNPDVQAAMKAEQKWDDSRS